ncbi:MAG: DUF2530 domain-containing protein [Candidatus Nanopelagicales bacterium]|nr:DUF2530 domain-containing protein [Candidatus Nanopelagicales bacterium]
MPESPAASPQPVDEAAVLAEEPLDVDGVNAAILGTVAFVIAFFVLLLFRSKLAETNGQWWLWVCVTGAGLGLMGIGYGVRRRSVYRAARTVSE